jgi:hypothetical protein
MNRDGPSKGTTTLTLLISIMQRSLNWHADALARFKQLRSQYIEVIEKERPVGQKAYDKAEYDRLQSLLKHYDEMLVAYELLLELQVDIERNPFPGQQLRLIQVARTLYPVIRVWQRVGRSAWQRIFYEFDIPADYRITFPTTVSVIEIHEIELTLLQLVQDDNTILATDVPVALNLSPNSKQYRNVKNALTNRGWQWKSRRMNNVLQKIVIPPV